jgi:hypothetical protein
VDLDDLPVSGTEHLGGHLHFLLEQRQVALAPGAVAGDGHVAAAEDFGPW